MQRQMIEHITSPSDQNTVLPDAQPTSGPCSDAWSVGSRSADITHVLEVGVRGCRQATELGGRLEHKQESQAENAYQNDLVQRRQR